jgi:2-polyprenyl-3-methyl-5-hydroxy-6-metoxy-1,4-benzoquinol methylase
MSENVEAFHERDGIWVRSIGVNHRSSEYDDEIFDVLSRMQREHFWYRGRHRFLSAALRRVLSRFPKPAGETSAIDLGGGCGGWVAYLRNCSELAFKETAINDSSIRALTMAKDVMPEGVACYQADLLDLGWEERWDVVFLLDVLEHIPDQEGYCC